MYAIFVLCVLVCARQIRLMPAYLRCVFYVSMGGIPVRVLPYFLNFKCSICRGSRLRIARSCCAARNSQLLNSSQTNRNKSPSLFWYRFFSIGLERHTTKCAPLRYLYINIRRAPRKYLVFYKLA